MGSARLLVVRGSPEDFVSLIGFVPDARLQKVSGHYRLQMR
jgi:hypothetical protein